MVQPIKIYVGNVPQAARNSELKELFEKFGKVVECDILKEFAFVHMDDTNDAKAAIAGLNDSLWKGSRIRVELSTTKTNKGEPSHRYKSDDLSERIRRRSSDRSERRSYHPTSAYSSRGNDPYMYREERALPYDRYNAPHRLSKNDLGNLGPMRESRYSSSINSRSYLPERVRPYPDNYDRNGDYMRGNPSSRAYGAYPYPASSYRSGSPHDLSREFRDNYADSYMRPPMDHYPPHHLNHASYYRGPPGPPGPPGSSSRYNYDHPSYGPPASTRGSRYTPPSSYPASSSSTSSRYRSHNNGATSPHHRDEPNDNYPAPYSNGRRVSPSSIRNGTSSKRRHQSASPKPDHMSSSHQRKSSSHIKSKEETKTKISSRSSSSNLNNSKTNGKKSHRSDTPMSSSAASSNSSSPSYSSVKRETTNSSQSNRSSRRRKLDTDAKKEKSFSPDSSPAAVVVVVDRKKKSMSRVHSHSNSPRSRSRSSKRSNTRY